jgi:hypothetical protein
MAESMDLTQDKVLKMRIMINDGDSAEVIALIKRYCAESIGTIYKMWKSIGNAKQIPFLTVTSNATTDKEKMFTCLISG